LLEEQGDIDAAIDAYDNAIQTNDQLSGPYYRRGVLLIEQRNYDEAIRNLRDAVGRQPDNAEAHYWLAQAYIAIDELRSAQSSLQRVTEISGADGELVARARTDLERIEQEQLAREQGS
jgi:tetratricopeptide (TPR) repeat protein